MQGTTTGGVRNILRVEALTVLILALAANAKWGIGWGYFALFFLTPDLSMFFYFVGPRIGAIAYNSAHSYLGGMLCVALGIVLPMPLLLHIGILWISHVGFDRALGYGLKYSTGFGWTHLGLIGRQRSA